MIIQKNPNTISAILLTAGRTVASINGNILVYLVVVILIFGVLGVTIVSLFTTATSSSATPNDARRAFYIAESGVRYAWGRIKNARFQQSFISEINTTAQYTLANGSSFTIDIFSPWFNTTTDQIAPGVNPFTLEVPNDGKIPGDFSIPSSDVILVNWDTFNGSTPNNPPPSDSYAEITASSAIAEATSLTITMGNTDDLAVVAGQIVCLAVRPTAADSNLQSGEDISIAAEAKNFFPPRNGSIRVVTADNQAGEYYYEELIDETSHVRLTNLAPMPQTSFAEIANFSTDDWVVLSRYNYRVITTGTSGDVTSEIGLAKQVWAFPNSGQWTIFEREFIGDAVANVKGVGVIESTLGATEDEDEIQLGEVGNTDVGFGTIWYGGDKPIGGDSEHCQAGRCLFGKGIRAFFTLDYSGDGEGFVFALINGADNTSDSAGGDVERSELLGYAGDSRENATGAPFLDGSLNGDGLLPPKMGIEFDTRTNFYRGFEQTLIYCNGSSLNPDTRNDPQPGGNDEDAVQYVFWGSKKIALKGIDPETLKVFDNPTITCRDDDSTYDDNKHDAEDIFEKWKFDTGGNVYSSPAVDTNVTEGIYGRVYVGSESKFFYGLNPADRLADGTENTLTANEWKIDTHGTLESDAVIGPDGKVYFAAYGGGGEGLVYAINPTHRLAPETFPHGNEWLFYNASGHNIDSSPAYDDNGTENTADDTIYIGADDGVIHAFGPDSDVPKWKFTHNDLVKVSDGRPAFAVYNNRKRVYVTGRDSGDRTLFALDATDRQAEYDNPGTRPFPNLIDGHEWTFDIVNPAYVMPGVDPGNGRIYSGGKGGRLVGLTPEGVEADSWSSPVYNTAAGDIYATPVVDDDGIIYVLPSDGKLHAVNTNGSKKWTFQSGGNADSSVPAIGPDGTVYFGSLDGRLYAVGHDGVSATGTEKFNFLTGDKIYTTPAIDPRDETVYIGSDSNYLHAINQLAEPRSYRDESVEDKRMVSSEDLPGITFADAADSNDWLKHGDGQWAVRIEVTSEGPDGPIDGSEQYDYRLKTWVEKCTAAGCSKFLSSHFRDTLINYNVSGRPPKLDQTIKLSPAEHAKFERFLFGFTSAAATGDTQAAIIKFFELSFIRVTDPDVTSDPNLDG